MLFSWTFKLLFSWTFKLLFSWSTFEKILTSKELRDLIFGLKIHVFILAQWRFWKIEILTFAENSEKLISTDVQVKKSTLEAEWNRLYSSMSIYMYIYRKVAGSIPVNSTKPTLMIWAILMSPNRTKHCVYGYIYIYIYILYNWSKCYKKQMWT